MTIEVENVTVAFGRTLAIDDVTVEIPHGVTGLFGPNGSGKSTLLRAIAGLLHPAQGNIAINGVTTTSRDESRRRSIGYSGHESGLYGRLSLVENLRLFATLYDAPFERIDLVIEQVAVTDLATRPVAELSAGSRRRASVAKALLHDPQVLLLDEPYANVDDDAAEAISRAVLNWKSPGKIAVVATHGAKKVRAYADGAIVLQRGRLARVGRYTDEGFTAS